MRTAINTRLAFEIPAKRRPGKQERRGVWLASRVVAALCRCGEPPLVDHGERSTGYRPFGAAAPAAWRSSPRSAGPRRGRWPLAMINARKDCKGLSFFLATPSWPSPTSLRARRHLRLRTNAHDTIRFGGHDRRSSLFTYAVSAYPLRRGSPTRRLFSLGRYDRRTYLP